MAHGSTTRADTPGVRGFSQFCATVNDAFVPLQVRSEQPESFRGSVRHVSADEVHVSLVEATEHVVERTPLLIATAPRRCYKVSLQLDGHGLLVQDGRETLLRPGSLAIYDTAQPYSLAFDGRFRSLVLMFPSHLVDLPLDAVGALTATPLEHSGGVGEVIVPHLKTLAANLDAVQGPAGGRLARGTVELIVTLLSQELAQGRVAVSPRQQLFADALRYIDAHLASPGLDPRSIAAAHFISPRLLHAIFRENGATVATWVRRRRLEECRVRLRDPAFDARSVMSIASEWCFTDAAYFSRAYRSEFGCSPSESRIRT
ncbi:helix-turn-helix domain-containing protein [Microbacterium sp.]|uniref:AraC-like ligand-binding domain-containing protein n=1 Tax=Microbacterium sp. TaxID=51671 RepID=UPI0039E698B8